MTPPTPRIGRRACVLGLATLLACRKSVPGARCESCGMKVDEHDPFFARLDVDAGTRLSFDSTRCAFEGLARHPGATLWVHEYYDQTLRPATELRFVEHSDVVGPMGPDLVPVDPAHVTQFSTGHGAGRVSSYEEAAARFATKR